MIDPIMQLLIILGGIVALAWFLLPHALLLLFALPVLGVPHARRRLRHRRCLRHIADLEEENETGPPWWCLEPGRGAYGEPTYYMPHPERVLRRNMKRVLP